MTPQNLYNKNFIMLSAAMFLASATFMLMMPVLPIFGMEAIGLAESRVGLMVGAFSITALISRPFIGHLVDTTNRKIFLLVSLGVFTLVIASYELVATLAFLLFIRMLQGGAWASISTCASTVVIDFIPPNKRAEGIGLYSLTFPLAMVIGPALGLQLYLSTGSFNTVFRTAAVICVFSLILCFKLAIPARDNREKRSFNLSPAKLYEKKTFGIAFMQYCYSFAYSGLVTFMPIYAIQKNINNFGYFFLIYALGTIISRIFVRRTFDLRGPSPLIFGGYIVFALGAVMLAVTTGPALLLISAALCGTGAGMVMPTINTMTMNVVKPEYRGRAIATVMTAMDLGMGTGALALGYVAQHSNFAIMYCAAGFMLIVPIMWYVFSEKKRYLKNLEHF